MKKRTLTMRFKGFLGGDEILPRVMWGIIEESTKIVNQQCRVGPGMEVINRVIFHFYKWPDA